MSTPSNQKPRPQLPHGSPTTFNGLSETFAFHSSPETFIASRVLAFQAQHDTTNASEDPRPAVHAKILNRNVAVISSHAQITHILSSSSDNEDEEPAFIATKAYEQFMAPFYPSPNLLLSDGQEHAKMRTPWERQMGNLRSRTQQFVKEASERHFESLLGSQINLYESLKTLIWKILLGLFLKLEEKDALFREIEKLQEDLLRGQFSLFPVSVNMRIWQSPRSRGVAAKEKLQKLIVERLKKVESACPFHVQSESQKGMDLEQVANHLLLFTSSLAVKGIASLLTAYLLNIFLLERGDVPLVQEVMSLEGDERERLMHSILLETERLSPPIVGIMRRVSRDTVISSTSPSGADVLIPKTWDAWLYFVGGGRDPKAFGKTAGHFVPDRFLSSETSDSAIGLAFASGPKLCLGQEMVRDICLTVARTMLADGLKLKGEVQARGVRAWLGWEDGDDVPPGEWAKDMKQLPTQRPARPVLVSVLS